MHWPRLRVSFNAFDACSPASIIAASVISTQIRLLFCIFVSFRLLIWKKDIKTTQFWFCCALFAFCVAFINREVANTHSRRVGREAMQPTAVCSLAPGSLMESEIGLEGLDSPTRLHFSLVFACFRVLPAPLTRI